MASNMCLEGGDETRGQDAENQEAKISHCLYKCKAIVATLIAIQMNDIASA